MRAEILAKITGSKNGIVQLVELEIQDSEIQEIINKIQEINPSISTIDLDNNNISNKGAIILRKCLHNFTHLKGLSVQFNKIEREGAISLFSLKKDLPDLDILFHGNGITNAHEMYEIVQLALGELPKLAR